MIKLREEREPKIVAKGVNMGHNKATIQYQFLFIVQILVFLHHSNSCSPTKIIAKKKKKRVNSFQKSDFVIQKSKQKQLCVNKRSFVLCFQIRRRRSMTDQLSETKKLKKCSEIHKHGFSKSVFSLFNYEKKEKKKTETINYQIEAAQ